MPSNLQAVTFGIFIDSIDGLLGMAHMLYYINLKTQRIFNNYIFNDI